MKRAIVLAAVCLCMALSGCGKDEKLEYVNGEAIALWNSAEEMPYYDSAIDQKVPEITPYIPQDANGIGVVLFPGGGYTQYSSETEGTDIAEAFNAKGISVFVVEYRLTPYHDRAIISDAARAVRYVRYFADEFGIDEDQITVMGFSAGGHLALMEMEYAQDEELEKAGDAIDQESAMPDAGVLCYPVVSMTDEYTHKTSRENFLGADNVGNQELIQMYSGECRVTDQMCPLFLWHCKNDRAVSYENSQILADALEENGVDYELHLYDKGGHGVGLASDNEEVSEWFDRCVEWLQEQYNK